MNGINMNTIRLEDIMNNVDRFETMNATRDCYNRESMYDDFETENYESYCMHDDNECDEFDDGISNFNDDCVSENSPYYTSDVNFGVRTNHVSSYNNKEDDCSDYYTESAYMNEDETECDCEECFSDGIEEGYNEGYDVGVMEGKNSTCKRAYKQGFCDGKKEGYEQGFCNGKKEGFEAGFEAGYEKAKQEVIEFINNKRKRKNCGCNRCKCCCRRSCN